MRRAVLLSVLVILLFAWGRVMLRVLEQAEQPVVAPSTPTRLPPIYLARNAQGRVIRWDGKRWVPVPTLTPGLHPLRTSGGWIVLVPDE